MKLTTVRRKTHHGRVRNSPRPAPDRGKLTTAAHRPVGRPIPLRPPHPAWTGSPSGRGGVPATAVQPLRNDPRSDPAGDCAAPAHCARPPLRSAPQPQPEAALRTAQAATTNCAAIPRRASGRTIGCVTGICATAVASCAVGSARLVGVCRSSGPAQSRRCADWSRSYVPSRSGKAEGVPGVGQPDRQGRAVRIPRGDGGRTESRAAGCRSLFLNPRCSEMARATVDP